MENQITLTVNGQSHTLTVNPDETLADTLRKRLKLTGTKIGCEEAECGVCTVLVDGEPTMSCAYPAQRANGKTILTIEGLARTKDGELVLHPLQDAFVQHGAVQCGFCIPGQIMTAYALIQHTPEPTGADIRYAFKDTLCRCAGYSSIESAILEAAHSLRMGEPVRTKQVQETSADFKHVGRVQIRPDAIEKVTGDAMYTDDLTFDDMLFAAVTRTGIPHGFLRKLDVSKAKALPGVVAVLTADDIPGAHNHGLFHNDWPVMVGIGERVLYVGDAVAIIAAETQQVATQAAALVVAEYEEIPPIVDPVEANKPDAVHLHESGNLLKPIKVRKGDMAAGFAEADVILEHTFHTPPYDHAFLEPECSIAVPTEDGRMEIYVGSQIPYSDRSQVAATLDWDESRVHIAGQLMGGGFGGKEDIAGQIHAALLANTTGRPVKLLWDRQESLIVHPKRHATQMRVKFGAKKDGRIVAAESELFGDTGAYASLGEKVLTRATTHSAGPYNIPHVCGDCYATFTNNPPAGAFRGFGVTQSAFAVESMIDMLADELGIDRIELRRINALRVGDTTNTGQVLRDSVGLVECIDKAEAEMRRLTPDAPHLFAPRPVDGVPHLVRAWGFATAYKNTGLGGGAPDKAGAEVELYTDGKFEVRTSSAELGQGLVSVLQLMVAEEMSVPLEQVRVLVMDTDKTPDGGPTTASRQTYVSGNAARLAAKTLRDAISSTMAEKYDIPPEEIRFEDGIVHVNGTSLSYVEVAQEMKSAGQEPKVLYEYWAPETKPLGEGGDMHVAFGFAAQAAEVEVNKLTGEVKVLRVISANDVGRIINALGLYGQVEGGVIMGLGNALTEHFILENGQVVTDRLARYRIPSIAHAPEVIPIVVEHPTSDGPYGAKGVGELVSIPTTPAITNAIYNAVGVRVDRLPVDQEKIAMELAKK